MHNKILYILLFLDLIQYGIARLEIIDAYYPYFVKSGDTLKIVCESKQETQITWYEQIAGNEWMDSQIVPVFGSKYVIQTFNEKPSGLTRSTLIKHNVTMSDRGNYICKDSQSNYVIFINVLYIEVRNLTSLSSRDSIMLGCSVSGFDSNPPSIDYDWNYNQGFIPHPHSHVPAPVMHGPTRLQPTDKYSVSFNGSELMLQINYPTSSDAGTYECSFTFKTNIGKLTLMDQFFLNGTYLSTRSAGAEKSSQFGFSVFSVVIVIVVPLIMDL